MAISGINNYLLNSYYSSTNKSNSNTNTNNTNNSLLSSIKDSKILKDPAMKKVYSNALTENKTTNKDTENKVAEHASALASSASQLSVTGDFKNDKGEFDKDSMVSAVKDFADKYNNTVSSAVKSDNVNVLRKTASMVKTTQNFAKSLSSLGIDTDENNKLVVNEDKLKNADEGQFKAVFNGNYSYSSKISERANGVKNSVGNTVDGTYDRSGNMSKYSNEILTTLLSNDA